LQNNSRECWWRGGHRRWENTWKSGWKLWIWCLQWSICKHDHL